MKKKTGINIILIVVTIIIWGFIISHIISYFQSTKEVNLMSFQIDDISTSVNQNNAAKDSSNIPWIHLDRDPFQTSLKSLVNEKRKAYLELDKNVAKNKSPLNTQPTAKSENGNKLLLTGIIINAKSKLAILLDSSSNETLFLHEGENYHGIMIKEILDNSIIVVEGSQIKELSISHQ